ncbi:MAG TPA: polysaccharide biosynthesis/export family protein, partial [Verrucomicrobiae bacterium]
TFVDLIHAPELMESVARKMTFSKNPQQLLATLMIAPARESDKVDMSFSAIDPKVALQAVNLYAQEAVTYTQLIQQREAADVSRTLTQQLAKMDADIEVLNQQLAAQAPAPNKPSERKSRLAEKLEGAREELMNLLARYTEAHPLVIQKQAQVNALQNQIKQVEAESQKNATPPGARGLADASSDQEVARGHLQALMNSRMMLAQRLREAQTYVRNPPGYCRIFALAEPETVSVSKSRMKVVMLAAFSGLMAGAGILLLLLALELLDPRLKTKSDVQRITELPVLSTLGNISKMSPASRSQWAFRTWISLQGRLRSSKNKGFVCGITSSKKKEGRSTWVNLLSQAASECGYKVLTIAATREGVAEPNGNGTDSARQLPELNTEFLDNAESLALSTSALSSPGEVTAQLTQENSPPVVRIPLPGWVWNLERRKQWQAALRQWRSIDNIVIFVELPPASEPEAVLLAENLPNLIWLTNSTESKAGDTREQIQMLRDAHCNLVGAVMNKDESNGLKKHFARWVGCCAIGILFMFGASANAQTNQTVPAAGLPISAETAPAATNLTFSAFSRTQRSAWQQRLTLGAGDMLNFNLYGQPELARNEVIIGPDGRVSYLQAQDILATGLTVDELRQKFDEELGKFYRAPRVIITPFAYHSKKYFVLGKVNTKGVFTLDRPVSVVEAVARAHGFETGILENQNSIDLVDLQRSFLMRNGKRVPVDLEKLFQAGDLSQNTALEPGDYLYFGSGAIKEIYVLGEVGVPGPIAYNANLTVISAIASRGGFNNRAYKSRVLVIRGSLTRPEKFVVDTWATLDARATDFKLQPKDIVFVAARPFIKAEELLDLAATAFIQSAVTAWAGQNVGPIFTRPVIPSL